MVKVDREMRLRLVERLAAGAQRKRGRTTSQARLEKARELFERACAEGRRPGCPKSFRHPAASTGTPPFEGWYLELEGMVSLAITAHRAGVRASDVEDLLSALGDLRANELEKLDALLNAGRAQEAFHWAGIAPEPAGPDDLETEFPEIAPIAEELGLTWEGFLSFLHAADARATATDEACHPAWLVIWAYLFQYDSAQRLFEFADFRPSPAQLRRRPTL